MSDIAAREKLLESPEMKEKYDLEYPFYQPDPAAIQQLKTLLIDKNIIIVMGTWCGDSRLQVPHFYKVLDESGVSEKQITLIFVDASKKAAHGLTDNLNIDRVPTFIITAHQKEIGRITEWPLDTLENDIIEILNKKQ
ncbi:thiol-disulfide isomerase/thioredoxin [Pedobacter cryoconitis]|uniref:Thiol-disulfide isomerase/thioredoxin n=1 Tax=Pedobacter cryoconitis TaxID=188932 RepID=A0A7W8ZIJ1_9SPHI|nr:thioredoxin family protein [Pedobacter cryoconitis]MBB5634647.1 thiol-disulfide isomerase/thioredoxin [Pedobacter cryoconitis]